MPDPTQAAPQPGAASAAPAGQPAPSSSPSIDPSEFSRLQSENARLSRIAQQYEGSKPFYESAKKYGFQKPEDFGRLEPLTKRGISLDKLGSIFEEDDKEPGEAGALRLEDIQKMLDERESKATRKQAEEALRKELDAEFGYLDEKKIREMAGLDDKADPDFVAGLKDLAMGHYIRSRQPLGADHPLYDEKNPMFGPAGKEYPNSLKAAFNGFLTKAQAHKLAKLGDEASQKPISTPGGAQPDSRKPAKEPGKGWMEAGREAAQAAIDRRKAQRAGA